jgi:hypothetical protein
MNYPLFQEHEKLLEKFRPLRKRGNPEPKQHPDKR